MRVEYWKDGKLVGKDRSCPESAEHMINNVGMVAAFYYDIHRVPCSLTFWFI